MSEICPKCKNGRLTFYDGAFEHEPREVCDNCGAYFEEGEFKGYLDEESEEEDFDKSGRCQGCGYPEEECVCSENPEER